MYGRFWDDICVETVAEIDRIDVVTFEIAVHDREENLEEQIDGIYQYRQKVQPCLAGHHDRHRLNRVVTRFLQITLVCSFQELRMCSTFLSCSSSQMELGC